jgi:hypothetical protein
MTTVNPGQLRITVKVTTVCEGTWAAPRRKVYVEPGACLHVIEKTTRVVSDQCQEWWIVFIDGSGPYWMRKHWFDNVTQVM